MKQVFFVLFLISIYSKVYSQQNNLIGTSWQLTKEIEYEDSDTIFNEGEIIQFISNERIVFNKTKKSNSFDIIYYYKIKKRFFSKYSLLVLTINKKKNKEDGSYWNYEKSWSWRIQFSSSTNLILAFPNHEDSWMKFYKKVK